MCVGVCAGQRTTLGTVLLSLDWSHQLGSAGRPEGPWDPLVSASLAGITSPPRLVFYMDSSNLTQGPMPIRQTLKRLSHLSSPKKKLIS